MDTFLPIAAIVIALGGILFTYFGAIVSIRERLSAVETKADLFWKVVENKMTNELKSPAHKRKDLLLDRMKEHALVLSEMEDLKTILNDEIYANSSKSLLGAILVVGRLEILIYEEIKKKKR